MHWLVFVNYWIEKCTVKHWNLYNWFLNNKFWFYLRHVINCIPYIMFNGILVYNIELKVARKHRYWSILCISFKAWKQPWETSGWDSKPGNPEQAAGELRVVWITSKRKQTSLYVQMQMPWILHHKPIYEGWNFNSGNYLFTTDTK